MLEVRLVRSLRGFTLDVHFSVDNDVLAILGPSGSGKTMTLQCIAGLVKPDEGFIKLNSKVLLDTKHRVNVPASKRRVGIAFQNYALFPHMTARQNIAYGVRNLGRKEGEDKVSELLERMHIKDLGERYPRQLSAGQQQRVALARALAPDPDVLLLDEPFSALDSLVRERLQIEIRALRSFYRGSILFVTHDLAEAYNVSSRISIFESGRIVQDDHIRTVVNSPSTPTIASLVGIRNLMKGQVTSATADGARVWVPDLGSDIRVAGNRSLTIGQKVTIGIRPEHVQQVENPEENTFKATIDAVTEGVTRTHCQYRVDSTGAIGQFTVARQSGLKNLEPRPGQSCELHIPPELAIVIPG